MKQIMPEKKRPSRRLIEGAFAVIDFKKIYLNNDGGRMLNPRNCDLWITIGIDKSNSLMTFTRCLPDEPGAFKMSRVCETEYARRIETNRALSSIIKAGFPLGMMGKQLPVSLLMDGSVMVDFRWEHQKPPESVQYSA